jgi:hypothetical protein
MTQICLACKAFRPIMFVPDDTDDAGNPHRGECHRQPPQILAIPVLSYVDGVLGAWQTDVISAWPMVGADESCEEWRPK